MRNFDLRRAAVAMAAAILASLASGSAGHTAALKGFYSIDATALSPELSGASYTNVPASGLYNTDTTPRCFNARVSLPDRATVTGVAVVYKSGPVTSPYVALIRIKLSDGSAEIVAAKSLTDNSYTRKTATIAVEAAHAVIDNAHYSHAFYVCLGPTSGDVFYAARIVFTTAR